MRKQIIPKINRQASYSQKRIKNNLLIVLLKYLYYLIEYSLFLQFFSVLIFKKFIDNSEKVENYLYVKKYQNFETSNPQIFHDFFYRSYFRNARRYE